MLLVFTGPELPLGFFRQGLLVIAAFLVTALHWATVTEHRDWGLPLAFSQDTISRGPGGWRLEIGRQQGWFLKTGYRCLCLHVLVTRRGSGAPLSLPQLSPHHGGLPCGLSTHRGPASPQPPVRHQQGAVRSPRGGPRVPPVRHTQEPTTQTQPLPHPLHSRLSVRAYNHQGSSSAVAALLSPALCQPPPQQTHAALTWTGRLSL